MKMQYNEMLAITMSTRQRLCRTTPFIPITWSQAIYQALNFWYCKSVSAKEKIFANYYQPFNILKS